jgi:hypothetical protein
MENLKETLQESVAHQRALLVGKLREPLRELATACVAAWGDRAKLEALLGEALKGLPYCKHLYVLDSHSIQITDNVSHEGLLGGLGRDRTRRPYLREVRSDTEFSLSGAYISLQERRPSLTATQLVRNASGEVLGSIGAYFALRDLPLTREMYEEPRLWQQVKGDPSIRNTVFQQTRVESVMDQHVDTVLGVVTELMLYHGVYHVMLHFSSSRAVVWVMQDPYRYRMLNIDALTDPDICFAFPRTPYPADALVPAEQVRSVWDAVRSLRLMDDMFYLRTGTLNIFNGLVGLTFSCDGSHYIPYDEFQRKEHEFWRGITSSQEA